MAKAPSKKPSKKQAFDRCLMCAGKGSTDDGEVSCLDCKGKGKVVKKKVVKKKAKGK